MSLQGAWQWRCVGLWGRMYNDKLDTHRAYTQTVTRLTTMRLKGYKVDRPGEDLARCMGLISEPDK